MDTLKEELVATEDGLNAKLIEEQLVSTQAILTAARFGGVSL